ncbi:MAG TPA: hypothetical protein VND93_20755 [Myxococcales bacterium]|jgi:pimeloyl-ACP methyl ester carboxylesterase|nr:hypothetical protein [Myxococcales bacterium]
MGDLKLEWPALFKTIEGLSPGAHDLTVQKEVIPIIFVPGIMGSRLKKAKGGEKVWDPDAPIFMLKKYGMFWDTAAKKKKFAVGSKFDPEYLVPYADDKEHNEDKFENDFPGASERGWGTVAWSSYGKVLTRLQTQAWSPAIKAAFDMPVYAHGYNWSASNTHSGKKLKELIDSLKKKYAPHCEHVVVVTHSMGGLVTASALHEHSAASSILGVLHGVMPATGSGAAYWRMKAGFERTDMKSRVAAWVLGSNGEEVTALLGNMPGGLQLLPSQLYTTNDGKPGWLQFADHDGKVVASRPQTGDPYEEIYKNKTDYWRAVNPAFLDPGKKPGVGLVDGEETWALYCDYIDTAKGFHQRVKMDRPAPTQCFYGTGKKFLVADRVVYKVEEYGWKAVAGEILKLSLKTALAGAMGGVFGAGAALAGHGLTHSDWWSSRGGFKTRVTKDGVTLEVTLQAGDGGGDGTVPESSGKAVKAPSRGIDGIGHEPAYTYDSEEQPVLSFMAQTVEKFCIDKIKKKVGG